MIAARLLGYVLRYFVWPSDHRHFLVLLNIPIWESAVTNLKRTSHPLSQLID